MKVQVKEILHEKGKMLVLFVTEYGNAEAYWEGETPMKYQDYQVEVDINDDLEWGKDIHNHEGGSYSICYGDNLVHFTGILESVDDDGYSILRFGEYIIPFMAIGIPFSIGSFIKLSVASVSLTPV